WCRAIGSRRGWERRLAMPRWRSAPSCRRSTCAMVGEMDQRRERVVPAEGMDVGPYAHVQRRVVLDGALGIEVPVHQRVIRENDEEQAIEALCIIDHLPQDLEGVHDCGGSVFDAVANGGSRPGQLL